MLAVAISVVVLVLSGCNAKNVKPIENGNEIGVVLMHGKGGDTKWVEPLATSLRAAGVQVVTPDMPWHGKRIYDKSFDESMAEINGHVKKLQSGGAKAVYVAGHSLGAAAAAGYAARHDDIQGIILLAPAHFTASPAFARKFVADLEKADEMIKSGEGEARSSFGDLNAGKRDTRITTATIYKSWFSATGPAEFVSNMKNIRGNLPVLYVAGSQDKTPSSADRTYAFDGAPTNPKSQFIIIDASHLDVPRESAEVVIEWLRKR